MVRQAAGHGEVGPRVEPPHALRGDVVVEGVGVVVVVVLLPGHERLGGVHRWRRAGGDLGALSGQHGEGVATERLGILR